VGPSTLAIAAAAFLTATLSGIAGIGGGTILIGIFYAIGLAPVVAVPLHAAVQFFSNASRTLAYARHVHWRAAGWFLLGGLPAPFVIAPWAAQANADWVRLLLSALILVSLLPQRADAKPWPAAPSFVFAGVLNGSVGMFVGATGLFVGRLFLRPEWSKETIVGTLALCQALGHLLKILGYASVGFTALSSPDLLAPLAVAVIAGTLAGRKLHDLVSEAVFRRLFNGILLVLALKLAWDALRGLGWL
jgi:uncharacterized membrane protein YfcA